jgi:hypothetical protein
LLRLFVTIVSLALFYLTIVLIASIVQLAEAADRIYMGLGQPVFWILLSGFLFFALSPIVMYFRLPKALIPPDEESGPKHDAYMVQLKERLKLNTKLQNVPLETDADVVAALGVLSKEVDSIIKNTASAVFVSTAVNQNGKLDGFITLIAQAKMVWQIASLYHQRPSPRQILYLYTNVGSAALLAQSIDDIDFAEVVVPIVVSIIPSLKGAVPGLQGISNLLVNSLSSGATNGLITLRVGFVAKQYCEALSTPSRSLVRRNATIASLALIGDIAKENSKKIAMRVWDAVGGIAGDVVDTTVKKLNDAADRVAESTAAVTKNLVEAMNTSAENVSLKIKESSTEASNRITSALDSTVLGVKHSLEVASNSVKSGADKAAQLCSTTADSTKQVAVSVADYVSSSVTTGASQVGKVYSSTVDGAKELAEKISLRKKSEEV